MSYRCQVCGQAVRQGVGRRTYTLHRIVPSSFSYKDGVRVEITRTEIAREIPCCGVCCNALEAGRPLAEVARDRRRQLQAEALAAVHSRVNGGLRLQAALQATANVTAAPSPPVPEPPPAPEAPLPPVLDLGAGDAPEAELVALPYEPNLVKRALRGRAKFDPLAIPPTAPPLKSPKRRKTNGR